MTSKQNCVLLLRLGNLTHSPGMMTRELAIPNHRWLHASESQLCQTILPPLIASHCHHFYKVKAQRDNKEKPPVGAPSVVLTISLKRTRVWSDWVLPWTA